MTPSHSDRIMRQIQRGSKHGTAIGRSAGGDHWRDRISRLGCREGVEAMRRTGQAGRIVNGSARPAAVPAGGMIAYTTAKSAVASITQSLAEEAKIDGILVNAILPSIMDTAANRRATPNADFSK